MVRCVRGHARGVSWSGRGRLPCGRDATGAHQRASLPHRETGDECRSVPLAREHAALDRPAVLREDLEVARVEAVVRLLPGFVGNPQSLVEESHGAAGLLEYPVFTKPPVWADLEVPEVLLSGHHGRIARWRRDEALTRTAIKRSDLVAGLGDLAEGSDELPDAQVIDLPLAEGDA